MPVHETTNDNVSKPLHYVKVVEGVFVNQIDDSTFKVVEGRFVRTWIKHDPGNKDHKIKACDILVVDIEDDESLYRLQAKVNITFTWNLAAYIGNLNKGDYIRVRVEPGTEPKVSFPYVARLEEEAWVNVTKEKFPKEEAERVARIKEIVAEHPALFVPKPKE